MEFQRSYRCYHCHQKFSIGLDAVQHVIDEHRNKNISILRRLEDGKHQSMHYPYTASELSSKISINFNETTSQITFKEAKADTPLAKTQKMSATPMKSVSKNLFDCQTTGTCNIDDELATHLSTQLTIDGFTQTQNSYIDLSHMLQEDQCLVRELSEIFPLVAKHLKNINRYDDWMEFMKLISEGKFPMGNIALHLLLDVSNWYAADNVTSMSYNSTVKRF